MPETTTGDCPLCDRTVPIDDTRLATHDAHPNLRTLCPGSGLNCAQVGAIRRLTDTASQKIRNAEQALLRVDRALALAAPKGDLSPRERGFDAAMSVMSIARNQAPCTAPETTAYRKAYDEVLTLLKRSDLDTYTRQAAAILTQVIGPQVHLGVRLLDHIDTLQRALETGSTQTPCGCHPQCAACSYHTPKDNP